MRRCRTALALLVMTAEDADAAATGEKAAENTGGWPDLLLEGGSPSDRGLPALSSDHPLYPLAAWAYHHADSLDQRLRWGLFEALSYAWPPGRGRSKRTYEQGIYFTALLDAGVSVDHIAKTWNVTEGHVKDASRDHRRLAAETRPRRVEVDHSSGKPYDPALPYGPAFLPARVDKQFLAQNHALADQLARDLGHRSFKELLFGPAED